MGVRCQPLDEGSGIRPPRYIPMWVVLWRPRYSSRYDLSQISLSFFDIDLWSVSFGSRGESRPAAETRRADEMLSSHRCIPGFFVHGGRRNYGNSHATFGCREACPCKLNSQRPPSQKKNAYGNGSGSFAATKLCSILGYTSNPER